MSKPQSKTQKRIDNNLRLALTTVCENALKDIHGFQWLTHQANYANFPASLYITCVFDTDENLQHATDTNLTQQLQQQIHIQLLKIGVKFKSVQQQITFDTEEACTRDNNGNWKARLASKEGRAVARNRP